MCLLQDSLEVLESRKQDVKNTFMVVSLTHHHAILVRQVYILSIYIYVIYTELVILLLVPLPVETSRM